MRTRWLLVAIEIVFFLLAVGCAGDSTDDGGADAGATTGFAAQVLPILEERCNNCHRAALSPQDDVAAPVLTADSAWVSLTQGSVETCLPPRPLVVPGDPQASGLLEILKETPSCGMSMPRNSGGLCTFAQGQCDTISRWIQEGALDN